MVKKQGKSLASFVGFAPERDVCFMSKKLPIGIDGFEKIITNDFYYVDKTRFIADLLNNWGSDSFYPPPAFWRVLEYEYVEIFFRDRCG